MAVIKCSNPSAGVNLPTNWYLSTFFIINLYNKRYLVSIYTSKTGGKGKCGGSKEKKNTSRIFPFNSYCLKGRGNEKNFRI